MTNVKFLNYLYIHVYIFLSIIFIFYVFIYLFLPIDYFNYFIDLFSSEILAILQSTNSKLNKVFDWLIDLISIHSCYFKLSLNILFFFPAIANIFGRFFFKMDTILYRLLCLSFQDVNRKPGLIIPRYGDTWTSQ